MITSLIRESINMIVEVVKGAVSNWILDDYLSTREESR